MARSTLKSAMEMASNLRGGGIRTMATKSRAGRTAEKVKEVHRAPKRFTVGAGKTAGRNSSGRITSFHRGGGAKRLQRIVDLKRNTPSTGVIERIDYDPNRSARLALVRWVDEVPSQDKRIVYTNEKPARPHMSVDPAATTTSGIFPLSSLCNKADERRVTCFSPKPSAARLMVGLSEASPSVSKNLVFTKGNGCEISCARDIFLSSFAPKAKGNRSSMPLHSRSPSVSPSFSLPRIAVAGAKPSFSATKVRDEAGGKNSQFEVRKWNLDGSYWANRMKQKAAVSWHGI